MRQFFIPIIFICLLIACNEETTDNNQVKSIFSNTEKAIFNAQDVRDEQKLMDIYHSDSISIDEKTTCIAAFASVQDTNTIDFLSKVISEDNQNESIKANAAFALGQIKKDKALPILSQLLEKEDHPLTRLYLLESIGKCGNESTLDFFNNFQEQTVEDSVGWMKGIYRLGLKNHFSDHEKTTDKIINLLNAKHNASLFAAHYLSRFKIDCTIEQEKIILNTILNHSNDNIKMALARSLKNISESNQKNEVIKNILNSKKTNHLIQINLLNTITKEQYSLHKENICLLLDTDLPALAVKLASIIEKYEKDEKILAIAVNVSKYEEAKILLQGKLLSIDPIEALFDELKKNFSTGSPTQKKFYINAICSIMEGYPFWKGRLPFIKDSVVKTAFITAGEKLLKNSSIPQDYKNEIHNHFLNLEEKDAGELAMLLEFFIKDENDFLLKRIEESTIINLSKTAIQLPRDIETLNILERLIAKKKGEEPVLTASEYNNPINWKTLDKLPSNLQARIKTKKGDLIVSLTPKLTPGTVANFVELTDDGYFDGKIVHRIVPNFVAQGGCPRGDGWGGMDFTIRSEFANVNYTTGTIGMASAGKDTEGSQFFFTHSPTPHLDGRYTNFGTIISGFSVLNLLEVGDTIQSVTITNE